MRTLTLSISLGLMMSSFAFAEVAGPSLEQLKGTVRLNNCSASLVALEGYQPSDSAMIMTNGHCLGQGSVMGHYPGPGEVLYHTRSVHTRGSLYTGNTEQPTYTLNIRELLYGTMTDTDLGIYLAKETYQEIKEKTTVEPFIFAKDTRKTLALGSHIRMTSSYWKNSDVCTYEKTVDVLKEGKWTFGPSLRLTSECLVRHGSSGSPLILEGTSIIVGIVNTMYEGGPLCEEDNPCEVGPHGELSHGGISQAYGQFVDGIYTCVNANRELDLTVPGCILPK